MEFDHNPNLSDRENERIDNLIREVCRLCEEEAER
jgi:hypothetical protein